MRAKNHLTEGGMTVESRKVEESMFQKKKGKKEKEKEKKKKRKKGKRRGEIKRFVHRIDTIHH